jgi:pimeloyl-ACP methyl ester carboxylesterase
MEGVFDHRLRSRPCELTSLWTPAGRYTIHARVGKLDNLAGRAAVILVPGLGLSGRYMVPLAEHLGGEYPVFAVDPPGFGRSRPKPPRALTVTELADALAEWMDALGLRSAVLVGNSLGCHVIAELAARHPERASRLVLNSPAVDPHTRTAPRQLGRLLLAAFCEPLSMIPIAVWDYLRTGPRRMWATFRMALRGRIEETLPRVNHPALVVRGTRDVLVSERWAAQAVELLPHGRLVQIPGAAHAANYHAAAEMAGIVRRFVAGSHI